MKNALQTETVEIALASDGNFFPGLLVTACSMARYASRDACLRFSILDGGLGEDNRLLLSSKLTAEHPRVTIRYFSVDDSRFSTFKSWTCGSRMTYARLQLAELVNDLDFVLYCDVDFLWRLDVAELWSLRSDEWAMQGVWDPRESAKMGSDRDWIEAHYGKCDQGKYINAGMLLMNLAALRSEKLVDRCLEFLGRHPDSPFVDQTAINVEMNGRIGLLDGKWNRLSKTIPSRELDRLSVIHFAADTPWLPRWWNEPVSPAWKLWHEFYGELLGMSGAESFSRICSRRQMFWRRFVSFMLQRPLSRELFLLGLKVSGRGVYVAGLRRNCEMGLF